MSIDASMLVLVSFSEGEDITEETGINERAEVRVEEPVVKHSQARLSAAGICHLSKLSPFSITKLF